MARCVAEALEPLRHDAAERKVDVRIGDLPGVRGDHTLLRQVWANLLGNAFKYTRLRDDTHIEVGAVREDDETVFFVRDNGVGFDMAYADKLFAVFQRLHDSHEFEGTGIGLATVRRIVERHGGKAWAQAALDQGATFSFSLPTPTGGPT
jgi:two-component system, chemotaxis family, sensor kinase Cph1